MNDTERLWILCSEALREQVSDSIWQAYLSGITPLSIDGQQLVLGVPNTLIRDRVESRFLGLIQDTVVGTVGTSLAVRLEVVAPIAHDPTTDEDESDFDSDRSDGPGNTGRFGQADGPASTPNSGRSGSRNNRYESPLLDPRYTFETFVIASSNRFAHAAAQSVAEAPARSYNPLFIYGDAGLGKTHLLHAIGNYVVENFNGRHVRYVSTETFMNEFVDAIRTNATTAFKRRYRECDVLLIDDVQFMEGKESLQEEFFHTFNSLYGASKQIVLTSDRPPKSIATLEDRLRSRFLSGLITEVQPPELETRLAILQSKAEREQVDVPDEVLEFIATHVKDNIRELEGALIRVTAYASLNRHPLSRDLAEHVLSDIVSADQPRSITPQMILEATSETFGFTIDEIKGPNRRRPLVTARQIGMYVFRDLTDFSYPAIAREFGGRDHTTVMHAVEKISNLMKERHQIYNQVTELILRIKNTAR
ncbi:MAG TPA: chromosomal replication initiator protein DnaA [Acidimicrobiales bacterium]|nr:chromosomal replication initiator protein DnaA [Acidimicrobiales bacterium]